MQTKLEASTFFDSYLPDALRRALQYAGDDGYVASMPQLLHARTHAKFDNEIWKTWFTSNSEESIATTAQGNCVMVTIHGGGIYASPEKFVHTYHSSVNRNSSQGFTGQYAGRISEREARDVVEGRLPDGTEIPVFSYVEFRRGISDLPQRYAVILDFNIARKSKSGNQNFERLKEDPLMIIRAGGAEAAANYLHRAKDRLNLDSMGNWHPLNEISAQQPQTRVLFLGGNHSGMSSERDEYHLYGLDAEFGLRGDFSFIKLARYVAVAPRSVSTSLRSLDFGVDSVK